MTSSEAISGTWDEERRLASAPTDRFEVTGDGAHIYWLDEVPGERVQFVWDGVGGKPFDRVVPQQDGDPFVRSADRGHVAYVGQRGTTLFVGIDEAESDPYADLDRRLPPTFSRAGRHLAYGALMGGVPVLISDGLKLASWRPAPFRPVFSDDEEHVAFVAENRTLAAGESTVGYRQWIVLDGTDLPEADGISVSAGIHFSREGRLMYAAIDGQSVRVVVDGVAGPPLGGAQRLTFSPDGRRFAYVGILSHGIALFVDHEPGPIFDAIASPVFSPDSRRLAYGAVRRSRLHVVVDGVEGPEFKDCWGDIVFSPDSTRWAYLSLKGGSGILGRLQTKGRAVVDGVATGEVWDSFSSQPHFSPDSRHLAFTAARSGSNHLVLDDVPGPAFDSVGPPRFGATGRLYYLAGSDGRFMIVAGGTRGVSVDDVAAQPSETFIVSPDGNHVASVVHARDAWRPLVDDRMGPGYVGLGRIIYGGDRVSFTGIRADGVFQVSTRLEG